MEEDSSNPIQDSGRWHLPIPSNRCCSEAVRLARLRGSDLSHAANLPSLRKPSKASN